MDDVRYTQSMTRLILCIIILLTIFSGMRGTECECLYPYGQGDERKYGEPWRYLFTGIDHNEWDRNIGTFTVYVRGGYIEYAVGTIRIQYWSGAGMNMSANPNSAVYYRLVRGSGPLHNRAKADVEDAFGDTTFEPYSVQITTVSNFTYNGGDETTEANTVQVVQFINQAGTTTYTQINVDIEWWNGTAFPVLGITRMEPLGNAKESIAYHIPGSGTSRIQSVLSAGNTGVPGRWMFTNTCDLCGIAYALGIPNGYLSYGSVSAVGESKYTSFCHSGYTGQMCETRIDKCANSPCGHGNCRNIGPESYNCTCEAGYTGANCDTNIDDCAANPCANGCCHDLVNNYICVCDPGWSGTNCDSNIDDCDSNLCVNGTCTDLINGYNCTCDVGFTGTKCDFDIDDCVTNSCVNGCCQDLVNNYTCVCHPGWTGTNCEETRNYRCSCKPGFTGILCDQDIDNCQSNPCIHGSCDSSGGPNNYTCSCSVGYSGTNCDIDIDDCSEHPCTNGTCIDRVNGFECLLCDGCNDKLCAIPKDYCIGNTLCQNGGSCVSVGLPLEFYCECVDGVYGRFCENDTRPSPGTYSEWSGYGGCTKTCDSGLQKRTRQCLRIPCDGSTHEQRLCNVNRCEDSTDIIDSLLLSTSKSVKEVVSEENEVKKDVAQKLNLYCSVSENCCQMTGVSVGTNFVMSSFTEDDVLVVNGFPRQEDLYTVQLRITVRIPTSLISFCTSQSGETGRQKRQTASEYVPVELLQKALGRTIGHIQMSLCCYNVESSSTQISTTEWGAIIGGTVTMTCVILVLFFAAFCKCRRKGSLYSENMNKEESGMNIDWYYLIRAKIYK